jgi:osmotically-inducible protein OsmY
MTLNAATKKEITDSGVTSAVEGGLMLEKGVYPNDVDVSTTNGVVTISGSVDNLLAKERALKIAESIRGVSGVIDLVSVSPVSRPDEDVQKDIQAALRQDPAAVAYHVTVAVKDSVATLSGSVGSYAEKKLATRIAKGVKGTKEVRNDVSIDYVSARSDAEIASDVMSRLQWDIWIHGDMLDAAVKDGKVTLTGTLGSAISLSRALDDSWVIGVVSVDDSGVKVEPMLDKADRRKVKYEPKTDAEVKEAVQAVLRLDPRVSAFSPDVTVEGGVVILEGSVGNLKAKSAAEQDTRNIAGVWQVDNFLKTRPKEKATDAEMEQELKAALKWDPLLDSATINAAVINRVAYLSGTADSSFQRAEAEDVASRTIGVALVRNRVSIAPEYSLFNYNGPSYSYYDWPFYNQTAYYLTENLGTRPHLSDEQIKKNIEDRFFWSPFVDRADIKVAVDGGVATLTGTVGTWIGWGEADKDARKSGASDVLNKVTARKGSWF